jgi:subtilase family serine protease
VGVETTIDVEWAHATAPGASIVLLTSPVAETNGVQGMAEFLYLETYALDHNLGTIISQSWGVTENTLFTSQQGLQVFSDFENLYARAVRQHVTVLPQPATMVPAVRISRAAFTRFR